MLEHKLLNTNKKSNAGAKPYDLVMMFKILILQRYYGLGDSQVEYQILGMCEKYQNCNTNFSVIFLEEKKLIFNEGQLIDASFTVAPRQRNTRKENKKIKDGKGNELWNDKPNKKKHKDIDARWTKKNGETFFGYKNHAKVGTKSKFINTYTVTDASVHDSQALDDLLTEKDKNQDLHADSAYTGKEQDKIIKKYEMKNKVHEKGYHNKPLTEKQKASNTKKSKIRARVEHVFGFMSKV